MTSESPVVSIIIPCFNQGKYIEETIKSVLSSTFKNFEIIIVNDGSTDTHTNRLLQHLNLESVIVIQTENQGVSNARNTAIRNSRGKFILPLDADDKISVRYIEEAVKILEANSNIKVVTSEVELFGAASGKMSLLDYSIENLLCQNTMVCSSIFRREDFDRTMGFNPEMKHGFEDWDFWLSILGEGGNVFKIPMVHFYYRIKRNSRNTDFARKADQLKQGRYQIYKNHIDLYSNHFLDPAKSFEFDLIQKSKEYKIGKAILKPVRYFFNLLR